MTPEPHDHHDRTTAHTFTGERIMPVGDGGMLQQGLLALHQAMYRFLVPYCRHKHVLDVGCGSGHGSVLLAEQATCRLTGCDLAADAVQFAAGYAPALAGSLLVCDALHLALLRQQFDVVTAIEVLEHVEPAAALLQQVQRVMKPQGLCFISTPNRLVYSPDSTQPRNPYHLVEYTYDELLKLLQPWFGQVRIQCITLQQRAFLVRYLRSALRSRLPVPLAAIERFLVWHLPPWNRQRLQPWHIVINERYTPTCVGFLAICREPRAQS